MTYSLKNQADGSAADTIFSISGTNVQVNTANYIKVGTYNLNLVGTVSTVTKTVGFTVLIQNPCDSVSISTSSVSATTYYTT